MDGRTYPKEVNVLRFSGLRNQGMLPALEAVTEFRLTVLAYNSKGAGPESEPYTFQTPEGGEGVPAWPVPAGGCSRGRVKSRERVLRQLTSRFR